MGYVLLVASPFSAFSQALKEWPGFVLEQQYGDNQACYEYKTMGITEKGELIIAALSHSIGKSSSNHRFWLWTINKEGKRIREVEVKASQADEKVPSYSDIKGLTILENGDVLLVVDFMPSRPSVVVVTKDGKQVLTKEIAGLERSISISKLIPTKDGNYLLIGYEDQELDLFAMKIDGTGKILWKKKWDMGKEEMFVDGLATEDSGFILVGNSGDLGKILMGGPLKVSVGKYTAHGDLITEKTFQGRYGSVARISGGSYVIAYDKSNSLSQDVWVKAFDVTLKELWQTQLIAEEQGIAHFTLAAVPSGGLLAVGWKAAWPYAARMDKKGNRLWTFQGEPVKGDGVLKRHIVSRNDEFFMADTVYPQSVDSSGKPHLCKKVRLMKLTVK